MIGQSLSHFRILSKIGQGGMGVVYKARDEKLRRDVALKVLPPDLVEDEERRARLLREARAAAAVIHQNIATVFEVDEANGVIFIVMELVEGKTLRSLLRDHPLPIPEALHIAIGIVEGLAEAHKARVIHRDLKPENVIVRPNRQPKILDFGLAKLLEDREEIRGSKLSQAETFTQEMTREGRLLGTAAYMSPEQARGGTVDARSDIFSFGITLYEMVTGKTPFQGKTPMDTLAAIINKQATPASQINPEVAPGVDEVLGRCLEKDPNQRYQHSDDLVVDLRKLKGVTEAAGFHALPKGRAFSRRWPLVLTGALVVLAAIFVGSKLVSLRERLLGGASPVRIESLAVLPLKNLSGDPEQEYFSDGMTDTLITELSKIGALRVISRQSVIRYKGSDKPLPDIARELNVDAVVEGQCFVPATVCVSQLS